MPHKPVVIDGVDYPSVTEFVKLADDHYSLVEWAKNNTKEHCDKVYAETAALGIERHDALSALVSFGVIDEESPHRPYIEAVKSWIEIVGLTDAETEVYVESKEHLYGGTLDVFGKIKDEYGVIDWMFTSQIRKSHIIQPPAYMQALKESRGIECKWWRIIRPYELASKAKVTLVSPMKPQKYNENRFKYAFKDSSIYIEEAQFTDFNKYWNYVKMCRELYNYVYNK